MEEEIRRPLNHSTKLEEENPSRPIPTTAPAKAASRTDVYYTYVLVFMNPPTVHGPITEGWMQCVQVGEVIGEQWNPVAWGVLPRIQKWSFGGLRLPRFVVR